MTGELGRAAGRRLLVVHAHPDDETIGTGGTLARYAAEGVAVTLVTCTRGERGEIIPADLAHLDPDGLGEHRQRELARALGRLGVIDHLFLDSVRSDDLPEARYRDSGMSWRPDGTAGPDPTPGPHAFALADPLPAARRLASVIRDRRPHVLITYDPLGGYRHPDHVQAHRVAMLAVDLAADGVADRTADCAAGEEPGGSGAVGVPWPVPRVCWIALPASRARPGEENRPVVVPDGDIDVRIDVGPWLAAKTRALRAHATQLVLGPDGPGPDGPDPDGREFAFADGAPHPVRDVEYYRFAPVPPERSLSGSNPLGRPVRPLTDLFEGLELSAFDTRG
ncbi:MAG: N-acetyl-D-myo-inositol-2-amino-2-deoxy-alpha-D-glucopyranoside deacetylase [Actinomycetota bacterium]|nr:N-acetyl-D-myo-inositol-2-amino-2-deoxy-alpha-D-glucopyranoside deacetylase [Actinomycetota bacterium]